MMRKDLKDIEVPEERWYDEAVRSRAGWRALCRDGIERCRESQGLAIRAAVTARDVVCRMCSKKFRRESDKARHKCVDERRKPENEQQGSVQCQECLRWFRSRGGLAVHRCVPRS